MGESRRHEDILDVILQLGRKAEKPKWNARAIGAKVASLLVSSSSKQTGTLAVLGELLKAIALPW
jgi:hypothetical protein